MASRTYVPDTYTRLAMQLKLAWGSLRLAPIIEDYHNNKRAHEGHAGGGRETIIQFVVA